MPSIKAFEEARTLRGASRPSRILEGSSVARDSVYEGTVCTFRFCRLKLSVQLSDLIRDKPVLASSEILHIARLPITRRGLIRIAVGTHIAMRPPHKAVRAAFPHTASTSGI